MFDQISGHYSQAKLTHKIKHHRGKILFEVVLKTGSEKQECDIVINRRAFQEELPLP